MKPPSRDETQLPPLTTDADIRERVEQLIGQAYLRQLWVLFIDEFEVQLPLLIPIDGLPELPTDDETVRLIGLVCDVMSDIEARSIVLVLERPGPETLTERDLAWSRSLRRACGQSGVTLRAQLMAHRDGVRWVTVDDPADGATQVPTSAEAVSKSEGR